MRNIIKILPSWASSATPVGALYYPHGLPLLPLWAPSTTHMGALCYPCGRPLLPLWVPSTTHVGALCYPCGRPLLPLWALHYPSATYVVVGEVLLDDSLQQAQVGHHVVGHIRHPDTLNLKTAAQEYLHRTHTTR